MITFAWILTIAVLALAVGQLLVVATYVVVLRRPSRGIAHPPLPRAAVVLAVRGPDPFLAATIKGLLRQDYPDYSLHVIVDSESDPAWRQVDAARRLSGGERMFVSVLRERRTTCSLKCGAMVEAVTGLGDDVDVVAFIDGDAVPHETWLAELVEPLLLDPQIAVTTGNRWYAPQGGDWGSLVRYLWNVGAVVQVWLNGIVWAGSMAMRRKVIDEIGVLEAWQHALSVDGALCRQIERHPYRVRFVPSVMMVNRERIHLGGFVRWAKRQLVAAKSVGSGWGVIVLHALLLVGSQLLLLALLVSGVWQGSRLAVDLAGVGLAAYWLSTVASAIALEVAVAKRQPVEIGPFSWMTARTLLRFIPAMVLTHAVYAYMMIGVYRCKRVTWRGIEYEIHGVQHIRMVEYRPFDASLDEGRTGSII